MGKNVHEGQASSLPFGQGNNFDGQSILGTFGKPDLYGVSSAFLNETIALSVSSADSSSYVEEGHQLFLRHQSADESENRLEEAYNAYQRALEYTSDSPELAIEAYVGLARVALAQGELPDAQRAAMRAMDKGKAFSALNELDLEAVPTSDKKENARRWMAQAASILGDIQRRQGHDVAALQSYAQAIALAPFTSGSARLGLALSTVLMQVEEPQGLKPVGKALSKTLGAFPQMGLGLILSAVEQLNASKPLWGKFQTSLYGAVAKIQYEAGFSDAAMKSYAALSERFPGVADYGLALADLYRDLGDTLMAGFWYQKVWNRHSDNEKAIAGLSRLAEQEGNHMEVYRLFSHMVRLRPSDCHAWCHLANAAYYCQNYEKALTCYETALNLGHEPEWQAMIAQGMGNIHADYLHNLPAARMAYEMAKTLNPKDVENYRLLGSLYFRMGDFANSQLVNQQSLRLEPNSARTHTNLAYIQWLDNDAEGAIASYRQAIAANSSYEIPFNNLGVIYLDTIGDTQEAIELFRRALGINPDYALAHYNIGRAYALLGNRTGAAICFRRAQELNIDTQDLDSADLTDRILSLFDAA